MVDKMILDKIIKYFKDKAEVAVVYLYGSQAKGTATKGSDIDLGVVMVSYEGYQGFGIPQVVFAQDLSKITGYRNVLVHGYLEVDRRQTHLNIQNNLPDLSEFARQIELFSEKQESK